MPLVAESGTHPKVPQLISIGVGSVVKDTLITIGTVIAEAVITNIATTAIDVVSQKGKAVARKGIRKAFGHTNIRNRTRYSSNTSSRVARFRSRRSKSGRK